MTRTFDYWKVFMEFECFMMDARDFANFAAINMAWNIVAGVLWAFRRRLNIEDALRFFDVLPPVLRAILVEDWHIREPVSSLSHNKEYWEDIRSIRPDHNFSPPHSVQAVAQALRRHVDNSQLERVLSILPAGAADFWRAEAV